MMKYRTIIIGLTLSISVCVPLFSSGTRLKAVKVEKGPVIDGNLNDPAWQQTEPFNDFKMVEPNTGTTPSEKTEARVAYDDKNLYIGIYCFTGNPSSISVTSLQYDSGGEEEIGDDLIRILLDPFQDKRNAYIFFVNAKGARTDGLAAGENYSTNWDGIWDASSKIVHNGWITEIKIPFKTISFNPKLKEWGINIERYIPYKQEIIRLSGISKDSFFFNPAEAALLEGIDPRKQGMGITFKPFATLDTTKDSASDQKREWKLDGGFDLYKNFTPNLVGGITYHTDFAETEVDDRRINLTRFPLYFPEKRSFFLEGSDIFSFGIGLGENFTPFFSRKIGLYQGQQVPIEWGAKLFGKIGNTNMALLDVRTESSDSLPSKNFFAGRISQNIFSESKVGVIFTSGNPASPHSNTLFGADFTYSTSRFLKNKNFSAGAWYVRNWNEKDYGKHYGYGFKIDYPNDLFDIATTYQYFGDSLEPGLGFLPRGNVKTLSSSFLYSPRPSKGFLAKMARQFFCVASTSFYWDLKGNIESSEIELAPLNFITPSGDFFECGMNINREVLPEPFEVSEGVVIPAGDYTFTTGRAEIRTAEYRFLSAYIEYETGNFYNGKINKLEFSLSFNHKGNIKLGVEGEFVHGNLPLYGGKFTEKLYQVKADFFLNTDMGLMTYIQYDSVSKNIGANIRLKWEITPGNIVYLVYNKSWEKRYDPVSRFYPFQDRGVIKIQLSIRP